MTQLLSQKWLLSSATFFAFLVVFVIYGLWLGDRFWNASSRLLDMSANTPVLLLGLALVVALIAGQFDLSVASMATLTTFLTIGLVVNEGWPMPLVIVTCLVIGVLGGLLNAFFVVVLNINAFIATLGTGGVFLGLSRVYSGGSQLSPSATTNQLPTWFSGQAGAFGSFQTKISPVLTWGALLLIVALLLLTEWRRAARTGDRQRAMVTTVVAGGGLVAVVLWGRTFMSEMPVTVGFLLAVGLVLWVMLRYTTFGRYLYATGGNPGAALLAGVKVRKETTLAFAITGLLAATAGIVLAARQGSASPDIGVGFLLPAFAAAFLSTVILSNGRFNVWGTIIGGTFLAWVSQGLIVGGVPFTWAQVIDGAVLLLAVSISTVLRRMSTT